MKPLIRYSLSQLLLVLTIITLLSASSFIEESQKSTTLNLQNSANCISSNTIDSKPLNDTRTYISGQVTNSAGNMLIGAMILVKGSSIGTVTNIDGHYKLNVQQGRVLTFSYAGHEEKEVTVDSDKVINVVLSEDTK